MAVSVKISGIDETFKQLDKDLVELVNRSQRLSALAATSELALVTPVDTGRARASWAMNKDGELKDSTSSTVISTPILGPVPKDKIETLYITNGTPYIQELNAGSSQQAPPRFIEKTIAKYFEVSGNFVRVI